MSEPIIKALIYCRVSTKHQSTDASGLDSQEHRCRVYAAQHGYTVEKVFPDDVTGTSDFMQRPGMVALISYLEANPQNRYVVIFDDLKRFARNTLMHLTLRLTLKQYEASVECLNYQFDETPEGEFMETLFAAQGQLEAQQNRRQTMQKMKSRMEKGYWLFPAPVGFRYEKAPGGGKVMVRNEPLASIVTEALEGYASGRFQTKAEVKYFLEKFPEYPKGNNGTIHNQRIDDLFNRVINAGYIEYPSWGVSLRKGQHPALISFETFMTIQRRMKEGAYVPARKNINADFPLRGFVVCECGKALTAGWTKGRHKHYPYYYCQAKGCDHYGKSIKRADLEGEFEALLKQLRPTTGLIASATAMFKDLWEHRRQYAQVFKQSLSDELAKKDRQVQKLLDRIMHAELPSVISAIETKIKNTEEEKLVINEKLAQNGRPLRSFEETYRTAMDFLANPFKLWASERLEHKRAVLKLTFAKKLTYIRGKGYTTAKTTLPFNVLADFSGLNSQMVRLEGLSSNALFDILTDWNAQLSYCDSYRESSDKSSKGRKGMGEPRPR